MKSYDYKDVKKNRKKSYQVKKIKSYSYKDVKKLRRNEIYK